MNLFDDDPWADTLNTQTAEPNPLDAPQQGQLSVVPENEKQEEKKVNVSESPEKVVVTIKGGAGYDAPWIVFHGENPAEVEQTIKSAFGAGLHETVRKAAQLFSDKPQSNFANHPASTPNSVPPQAQTPSQAPPGQSGGQCPHGERIFKSGVSQKTGRPWQAWDCPARADGCQRIWANNR